MPKIRKNQVLSLDQKVTPRALQSVTTGCVDSPALNLRTYLGAELNRQYGDDLSEDRWSLRRTFAFVVIFCATSWAGIFFAIKAFIG